MQELLTDDLLERLLRSSDPIQFADKYHITERTLPEYLQQLLEAKGLRRPDVIREAQIGETYGYYIFTGQRHPTRDFVIRIALAMRCSLLETNRLLQAAGLNELYCKNRRDVIIIYGIDHGFSLQRIDEQLYRFDEKTLQDAPSDEGAEADVAEGAPSRSHSTADERLGTANENDGAARANGDSNGFATR